MAEYVYWVSNIALPAAAHDFAIADPDITVPDLTARIKPTVETGAPVSETLLPRVLRRRRYETGSADEVVLFATDAPLPPIFKIGMLWVAADSMVEMIRQADIGTAQIRPVELTDEDGIAIPFRYFLMHPANRKSAFDPENSPAAIEQALRLGGPRPERIVASTSAYGDGDIRLDRTALEGSDLWIEPKFLRSFFVSAALGDRLIASEFQNALKLVRAAIIEP